MKQDNRQSRFKCNCIKALSLRLREVDPVIIAHQIMLNLLLQYVFFISHVDLLMMRCTFSLVSDEKKSKETLDLRQMFPSPIFFLQTMQFFMSPLLP